MGTAVVAIAGFMALDCGGFLRRFPALAFDHGGNTLRRQLGVLCRAADYLNALNHLKTGG